MLTCSPLEPTRFESLLTTIEYLREQAIRLRLEQTAAALQRSIDCLRVESFALDELPEMQSLPLISEAARKASETSDARTMLVQLSRLLVIARTREHRPIAVGRYADAEYRRTLLIEAIAPLTRTELDIMVRKAFGTADSYPNPSLYGELLSQATAPPCSWSDIDAQVPIGYGSD